MKRREGGFGIVRIVIIAVVTIGAIIGFFFVKDWWQLEKFTENYHTTMRTGTIDEAYALLCPEFQKPKSRQILAEVKAVYARLAGDDIGPADDSQLDPSVLMDVVTRDNSGVFASRVYRSGKIDVGIVAKKVDGTYCIFQIETRPL